MTKSGDPLENALAERVNGILKQERLEKVYPTFTVEQLAVATAVSIFCGSWGLAITSCKIRKYLFINKPRFFIPRINTLSLPRSL
jgi:hypothetical protein